MGRCGPCSGFPRRGCSSLPVGAGRWLLVDRARVGDAVRAEFLAGLDATRPVAAVAVEGLVLPAAEQVFASDELVRGLALVLGAAESAGIARWCLDTASEYAKVRVQFGRPIGQFQAVKHALADMLVAVEQCAAVAWDAASAWSEEDRSGRADAGDGARLAACIAGSVALPAAARCAKQCVQTLGGIGFTWEHDAHLYLKRAVSDLQLLAGGDAGALEQEVTALAVAGARRELTSGAARGGGSAAGRCPRGWSSRWQRRRRGLSVAKRWPSPA